MFRKFSFFGVFLSAVFLIFGCAQEQEPLVQEPEAIDAEELESSIEEQEPIAKEVEIPQGAIDLPPKLPMISLFELLMQQMTRSIFLFSCKRAGELHLN